MPSGGALEGEGVAVTVAGALEESAGAVDSAGCIVDGEADSDGDTVGSAFWLQLLAPNDAGPAPEAAGGTASAKASANVAAVDQITRRFIEPHPPFVVRIPGRRN